MSDSAHGMRPHGRSPRHNPRSNMHVSGVFYSVGVCHETLEWLGRDSSGISGARIRDLCPHLYCPDLVGGFRYFHAETDNARPVLRLLREAVRGGGMALNYVRVEQLLRDHAGQVRGVVLRDHSPEAGSRTAEVRARVVINAAGHGPTSCACGSGAENAFASCAGAT